MGTNKRYERQIDERQRQRLLEAAARARPRAPQKAVRDWHPPWPPIRISDGEWIIMRDSNREPVGIIRTVKLGPREQTFYRVVTWAPTSGGRELVGYYDSLDEADRSILFTPSGPKMPDIRTSSGH